MWLYGSYDMDPMHREEADSANVHTPVFKAPMDGSVRSASVLDSHSNRDCGSEFQGPKIHKLDSQEINPSKRKMTLNHQCSKCLKAFCSPSKLQRHFLIHTGQKPYSCAVCLKRFTQKVHLKSHLKTATKCSLSPSNERQRPSLSNDKPRSSIQQPSRCPGNSSVELHLECKISVNSEKDLKTKIKPDADVKPGQWLNTSSNFQEREEQFITDTDLKPYQCVLCSRSFRLEANLARHHKSHRNQKQLGKASVQTSIPEEMSGPEALKPFRESSQADAAKLNIAINPRNWSKTCSNYVPWQLMNSVGQRRKNINTTSKQQRNRLHQCQACSKCFPSVSKLHRHMMTHTGERPFSCETCGKRFRQKTHLRVHCRAHLWSRYHKQRSLYINRPLSRMGGQCRTPADGLLREMVLREKEAGTRARTDEIAVKHLDQISSIDIFRNNDEREPKDKLLPHASKNSEGSLMNKESTATAKWRHAVRSAQYPGNRRHRCFQCLKCFPCPSKLKRHEMVHAGVKPFKCSSCGKAFRQTSHLKVHERRHGETNPSLPPCPRVTAGAPPQKRFENMDSTHSDCDGAVSNREPVLSCAVSKISVNKCLKPNITAATRKQSKPHRCQICSKYFQSLYKLSRHSLTHSGIRPYKCTVCCKAFTQRSHLKVHEHRCRQAKILASDCTQIEFINTTHTQDICLNGLGDFNADATRVQQQSHDNMGQCSFSDEGSNWLSGPELCLQEGTNESEQRKNCNKAADDCFSFPSALAYEINKLVQNQRAGSTLSHVYDHSARNVGRQDGEVITISDSDDSAVENQIQPDLSDGYWCEPAIVFESAKLTEGLRSQNDPEQRVLFSRHSP